MTPAERAPTVRTGADICTGSWELGPCLVPPGQVGDKQAWGTPGVDPWGMGQRGWAFASCILGLVLQLKTEAGVSLVESGEPPVWGEQQGACPCLRSPPRPRGSLCVC